MGKEKPTTKICKHCKTEISYGAKVCPQCRKKQGGNGCLTAIIVFFVVGAVVSGLSGKGDSSKSVSTQKQSTVKESETETKIEYTSYRVDDMMADLKSNALKASEKYKDQHIEVTGKLRNIDSSGKYISLNPIDDNYAIIGVQCFIKNDDQKSKVMNMTIGQDITLKGKITRVGEVLGYSLDIEEMN